MGDKTKSKRITTKDVRSVVESLDNIVKYYKEKYNPEEKKDKRDWRTYEQQLTYRMKKAARELKDIIREASKDIIIIKDNKRGRPYKIGPEEKTLLVILQQIFGLSNRKMSQLLLFFSMMPGEDVSYKTIERAYSNPVVQMILHNMFILMIKEKKIKNIDASGDGTGYSLSIKKFYSDSKDKGKRRKDFVYVFYLLDLDSLMYVGYGFSRKSEKDAYNKARIVLKELGIHVDSIRLDRYYSNKSLMKDFDNDTAFYIIPKKNVTVKGLMKWKRTLERFISGVYEYLKEYFKRNLSESMFSVDKRFFGGYVRQKRDDRINLCLLTRTVIHNLLWMYK